MTISSHELIAGLLQATHKNIAFAKSLQSLPYSVLIKRPAANAWNIPECLEHLNIYGNYYLPEIEQAMAKSHTAGTETFKSGWLGNYFAQSMLPKDKPGKMKALKSMNPIHRTIDSRVIDTFIQQQYRLLELLELSQHKNLNTIKIRISIARFIKIRLGDTFRFLVNHNIRHIEQAGRILN